MLGGVHQNYLISQWQEKFLQHLPVLKNHPVGRDQTIQRVPARTKVDHLCHLHHDYPIIIPLGKSAKNLNLVSPPKKYVYHLSFHFVVQICEGGIGG